MNKEAVLYKKLENKAVQCLACKHRCIIQEGRTGICSIRGNENGKLYLYAYNHPAAVNLDPIEKKPFNHFYPGTFAYSLGTFGCNFRCRFCQNWELSQYPKKESKYKAILAKDLIIKHSYNLTPEQVVENALALNANGIAYTYNEPAIWAEYAHDISEIAHKKGLYNVFVSSGYETNEALDYLKYIDAYNIDLKGYSNDFYLKMCGTKLDNVLDTIKEIYKRKKWLELTTLLIPQENDEEEGLSFLADFIASELSKDVPWHLTRFYPHYLMQDKAPTPLATLYKAYNIAKEHGLHYVYIGNVHYAKEQNTYCPKCGTLLIERSILGVKKNYIKEGKCPHCGFKIAGVFE